MKLKSEKGFTGVDITVALIIILLFMSLISVIFFNITKTSKSMDRNSEATYIATSIIEDIKAQDYDNVKITAGFVDVNSYVYTNSNKIITVTNNEIADGYTCTLNVENGYSSNSNTRNDLVKVVTVKVEYKVANEKKNVELSTTLVREF